MNKEKKEREKGLLKSTSFLSSMLEKKGVAA
jgi:hypothetical protein